MASRSTSKPLGFSELPIHVRQEVQLWQDILKDIVDKKPLHPLARQVALRQRVGVATVYRKLRAFERHGWRGLINRAKFPMNPSAAPHPFQIFLHGLWLVNKKNYKITHEQIVAMWKGGAQIPGYPKRPEVGSFTGCPEGWTYENMIYLIKTLEDNYPEEVDLNVLPHHGLLHTEKENRSQ